MTGIAHKRPLDCGCAIFSDDEGPARREWCEKHKKALPVEVLPGPPHTGLHARAARAESEHAAALLEIERLKETLQKVNAIRNSIIGLQTINWSEHIYPLVAALDEAGIEGMPYDEARPHFGTMLERTLKAEDELDMALGRLATSETLKRAAIDGNEAMMKSLLKSEAGAAAMREALQRAVDTKTIGCVMVVGPDEDDSRCLGDRCPQEMVTRALATDAGAALLAERSTLRIDLSDATNRAAIAEADAAKLKAQLEAANTNHGGYIKGLFSALQRYADELSDGGKLARFAIEHTRNLMAFDSFVAAAPAKEQP